MLDQNKTINLIRKNLGKDRTELLGERPPILPTRLSGDINDEIRLFIHEVRKLSGIADEISLTELCAWTFNLVKQENIRKAVLWNTPNLVAWKVRECLESHGVEIIPHNANNFLLAECDLGVTEADFILPDTGTIVLNSSKDKPRTVSLLPRIHLAIVTPNKFRADMHPVFEEMPKQEYLVFITGPSRTADIELTVTLGVHGPKILAACVISDSNQDE
jgi:L-lactate dehydrogenase complex protein LldG